MKQFLGILFVLFVLVFSNSTLVYAEEDFVLVINYTEAVIYEEASEQSEILKEVEFKDKLITTDYKDGWYEVLVPNSETKGYIAEKYVVENPREEKFDGSYGVYLKGMVYNQKTKISITKAENKYYILGKKDGCFLIITDENRIGYLDINATIVS